MPGIEDTIRRMARQDRLHTLAQAVLSAWQAEYGYAATTIYQEPFRLLVFQVSAKSGKDGTQYVDCLARLEERVDLEWVHRQADPDEHYLFVGPRVSVLVGHEVQVDPDTGEERTVEVYEEDPLRAFQEDLFSVALTLARRVGSVE